MIIIFKKNTGEARRKKIIEEERLRMSKHQEYNQNPIQYQSQQIYQTKKFYYLYGNDQKGPVSIEQLKSIGIESNTLVWKEGLDRWTPAGKVEELKILFKIPSPPPIPSIAKTGELQIFGYTLDKHNKSSNGWWIALTIIGILGIILLFIIGNQSGQVVEALDVHKVDNTQISEYQVEQEAQKISDYFFSRGKDTEMPYWGADGSIGAMKDIYSIVQENGDNITVKKEIYLQGRLTLTSHDTYFIKDDEIIMKKSIYNGILAGSGTKTMSEAILKLPKNKLPIKWEYTNQDEETYEYTAQLKDFKVERTQGGIIQISAIELTKRVYYMYKGKLECMNFKEYWGKDWGLLLIIQNDRISYFNSEVKPSTYEIFDYTAGNNEKKSSEEETYTNADAQNAKETITPKIAKQLGLFCLYYQKQQPLTHILCSNCLLNKYGVRNGQELNIIYNTLADHRDMAQDMILDIYRYFRGHEDMLYSLLQGWLSRDEIAIMEKFAKPRIEQEQEREAREERKEMTNEQFDGLNKFLITNNSVGYFKIGGSWQNFAEKEYHYKYNQSYGTCVDACCNGGFDLGNDIMTIGTLIFEESKSYDDEIERNRYKNNPNVFYVSSDNCRGWYWKDKISFIVIYSDLFKTKEGVGVSTTLEDAQKKLGKLVFDIEWIEENANAVQFNTSSYPEIEFVLDADDYVDGWEELSNFLEKETNKLTISDFHANTKIKRIIVRG